MIGTLNNEFNHYFEMLMKNVAGYFEKNKAELKNIGENIENMEETINDLKSLRDNDEKGREHIKLINNLNKLNLHLDKMCPGQWNTDLYGTKK